MKTEMYNVYRTNGMTGDNIMKIKPNDVMIRYTGRIDWTDAEKPVWVYPCTSAEMKFTGNTLKIKVSNRNNYWDNYLGCIIDQSQRSYLLNKEGITELDIVVPDNDTNEHRVLFFKRQDACHEVTILEYEIGDGERLLPLKPLSGMEIRCQRVKYLRLSTMLERKTRYTMAVILIAGIRMRGLLQES